MFKKLRKISLEQTLTVVAVFVLLFVIALATYDKYGKNDVSVTIKLHQEKDPFVALPNIVPEDNIRVIRQIDKDRNEYKVIISTRKKRKELLERIMKMNGVEDAKITP
jgi:hypothetical protein